MDIMGKKVVHKHLGEGIISDYKVKNGVSYIVVDFSEDNHKEFLFPELLEQKQKRDKEKEDAIKLQRKKEQKNLIRDEIISNKGRTPKRKNKINSTKKTSN